MKLSKIFLLACCLAQTAAAPDWSKLASQDIAQAYQLYLDNHAGGPDPQNPGFKSKLEAARDAGLALAKQVNSPAGYAAALERFSAELRDGHSQIIPTLPPAALPAPRWPGFVPAWRGNSLLVYASEPGGPPTDATIESCDGKPVRDLIMTNVFAYEGRPAEAGQWWVRARDLFRDDGNPFVTLPKRCHFLPPGGAKPMDLDLDWQPANADFTKWRDASYNGEVLPAGLTEPRPNLFWFAMPSFAPDQAQRDAYSRGFATLAERRLDVITGLGVVIDLRGNQGGSSDWSWQFSQAMWGKYVATVLAGQDNEQVWWRASPGNTQFVAGLADTFRSQNQPDMVDWAAKTAALMQKALEQHQPYAIEPPESGPHRRGAPPPHIPPVFVIVPGQCSSACLDAVDLFKKYPRVMLVGAPSSADSTYLEIRSVSIGDGRARVTVPMKLYRNRPRAAGEIYPPDIMVTDLGWTTAAFRKAIENAIREQHRLYGR